MKPMLNVGQRQSTTEKQIQLLLEKGYDIYVLRLRKLTEYSQTIHGFDDIAVRQYKSPNSNEVSYRLEMRPSSYATFEPNEEGVATAYVPGTRRNIDVIASHLYSRQFTLMEIMKPTGTIPQRQAIEKITQRADELGIKPMSEDSEYSRYLARLNEKPKAENTAPAAETVQSVIKERPGLPESASPKTIEEAEAIAETQVLEKYSALCDYLKKKSPEGWRKTGEYKSVIKPEIELVQGELIKLAGLKVVEKTKKDLVEEDALVK